ESRKVRFCVGHPRSWSGGRLLRPSSLRESVVSQSAYRHIVLERDVDADLSSQSNGDVLPGVRLLGGPADGELMGAVRQSPKRVLACRFTGRSVQGSGGRILGLNRSAGNRLAETYLRFSP